ncbi:hypothetical protein HNR60_002618 [Rhodopseudomonas rhenobacensis]|uniref:Uncharacterized protein n=1 Tax=Rhodopseudomonas rhenobacensis TaxID=87461 RepID=A0A7W7Z4I5_9BRAD|nr:hypothetical protein [Rhodopseudomonas rhenobacensis]
MSRFWPGRAGPAETASALSSITQTLAISSRQILTR